MRDAEFTVHDAPASDAEPVAVQRLGAEPLAPPPVPRRPPGLAAPVALVRNRAFWYGMASTVGLGLLAAGVTALMQGKKQ